MPPGPVALAAPGLPPPHTVPPRTHAAPAPPGRVGCAQRPGVRLLDCLATALAQGEPYIGAVLIPRYPLLGGWSTKFVFGWSEPLWRAVTRLAGGRLVLSTKLGPSVQQLVVDELVIKVHCLLLPAVLYGRVAGWLDGAAAWGWPLARCGAGQRGNRSVLYTGLERLASPATQPCPRLCARPQVVLPEGATNPEVVFPISPVEQWSETKCAPPPRCTRRNSARAAALEP
jgi:hypothetical protein